jgi:uncharacterized glyoxalase superfamily protein PhnB
VRKLLFLVLLVFLSGCAVTGSFSAEKIPKESLKRLDVYFCPGQDCSKVIKDLVVEANSSVHCAFYNLQLNDLIKALDDKSKTADVKLVVDNDNFKFVGGLAFAKQDDDEQLMHNKFCIFDSRIVLTGSFNPSKNGLLYDDNNVVVIESDALAKNYEDEFNELWNRKFGKGSKVKMPKIMLGDILVENYFCPEDMCSNHVVENLLKANKSIYFMTFSFTKNEIANAVIARHQQGVEVKGVFEKSQDNIYTEYEKLLGAGADVKWDKNPKNMHHKVFIIDEETVVTGSFNPTESGDTKNDENVLIIHDKDVAAKFMKEFWNVWNYDGVGESKVMISAVYYDTLGKDSDEEFIEIKNTGEEVDLRNWKLMNNKGSFVLNGTIGFNETKRFMNLKFSLANKNDSVSLKNANNELVDSVAWEGYDGWSLNATTGKILLRERFDKANSEDQWVVVKYG